MDLVRVEGEGRNRAERPASAMPAGDKVGWLREVDEAARGVSGEVIQVRGSTATRCSAG